MWALVVLMCYLLLTHHSACYKQVGQTGKYKKKRSSLNMGITSQTSIILCYSYDFFLAGNGLCIHTL